MVSGGGGGPTRELETDRPAHPDLYTRPRARPFHYCRFAVEERMLVCDVLMLQEDGSWQRVDGFKCP